MVEILRLVTRHNLHTLEKVAGQWLAQSAKNLFGSTFIDYQNDHITIFLDNVVTGYSLPFYRQQFEINDLKIDRSYVNNLKSGLDRHTMCEANIMVARKLKLKLIAQGMETQQ